MKTYLKALLGVFAFILNIALLLSLAGLGFMIVIFPMWLILEGMIIRGVLLMIFVSLPTIRILYDFLNEDPVMPPTRWSAKKTSNYVVRYSEGVMMRDVPEEDKAVPPHKVVKAKMEE